MSELNQLLLNFDHNITFDENDYFVSKSNFFAYNLINKWPIWEKKILNISGEKFSGKSHLANIYKNKSKAVFFKGNQIDNDTLKKIKILESVVIDDFEDCTNQSLLYSIFNLVEQDNKYLLITSKRPINEINFELIDLRSRTKNCLIANLEKPDDELIFAIILKNFSDRQIELEKKIVEFVIKRIDRSYSKIYDFIYKVDELSLKKKQPINFKTIKEIL